MTREWVNKDGRTHALRNTGALAESWCGDVFSSYRVESNANLKKRRGDYPGGGTLTRQGHKGIVCIQRRQVEC